jgi:hypothetical protein
MKTITELDAEEAALRDRAWRFERLSDALFRARQDVERLTPRIAAFSAVLSQLDAIEQLACSLPPDVLSKGGGRALDMITTACTSGRTNTTNRRAKDMLALDAAVAAIPRLELQLAEFQD